VLDTQPLTVYFSPTRKPVTKHTFRQYRMLGKGGFGEVRLLSLHFFSQSFGEKSKL
jgi:hypothetical protein